MSELKWQGNSLAWNLLLVFLLAIPVSNAEFYYYFAFLGFAIFMLFQKLFLKTENKNKTSSVYYFPLYMIGVWAIGIFVGSANGNHIEYIVRNFGGTAFYLLFYVITYKQLISPYRISKILYVSSIISGIIFLIAFMTDVSQLWPFSQIAISNDGDLHASTKVLIFVLEAVSLSLIIDSNSGNIKRIANAILFIISTWLSFVASNSGGYNLAYLYVLFFILYRKFFINKGKRLLSKHIVLGCICIIMFVLIVVDYNTEGIFFQIFSEEDIGNSKRYFQIKMILDRLSFFGNGLGAEFNYGFGGRFFTGYGIEVSYLNLIDKYGFFSLIPLYIYYKTFIKALLDPPFKNTGISESVIIGLMGYAFIALGNPVLLAPYNVILHVLTLYLLHCQEIERKMIK